MILNNQNLLRAQIEKVHFSQKLEFEEQYFQDLVNIYSLKDVYLEADASYDSVEDLIIFNYNIRGIMLLPCAISLETVEYPFDIEGDLYFTSGTSDDFDIHQIDSKLNIKDVLFAEIALEIPYSIKKEDAQYLKGDDWEVIAESNYQKEPKSKLADLKDLYYGR